MRVADRRVHPGDTIRMMSVGSEFTVVECGYMRATSFEPAPELSAGEVGYITASIKAVRARRGGRHHHPWRITPRASRCRAYRAVQPMVFCGIYPADGAKIPDLRDDWKLAAQRCGAFP